MGLLSAAAGGAPPQMGGLGPQGMAPPQGMPPGGAPQGPPPQAIAQQIVQVMQSQPQIAQMVMAMLQGGR